MRKGVTTIECPQIHPDNKENRQSQQKQVQLTWRTHRFRLSWSLGLLFVW